MVHVSHKYARGYLMLEKKTLDTLRVPDPRNVQPATMRTIVQLVDNLLLGNESAEAKLDEAICRLYGLSEAEMKDLAAR